MLVFDCGDIINLYDFIQSTCCNTAPSYYLPKKFLTSI